MVRIFTTSFHFNHEVYDTIVTMVEKDGKLNVTAKVMDISLQELLPGGTISFDANTVKHNSFQGENALAEGLMKSISVAVERHLVS